MVTTAVPFSWLTSALSTPSSASRAFFTVASQCMHIIPSIVIVFVIVFSFLSAVAVISVALPLASSPALSFRSGNSGSCSASFSGLSFEASNMLNKFSRSAFETTKKLERLIAAAPNIGLSWRPNAL